MKWFWEVILDDKNSTFEVIGTTTDDTLFTNNIVLLQKTGFKVHCDTPDGNYNEAEVKLMYPRYKEEKGLYQRLLLEWEQITGKTAKRW